MKSLIVEDEFSSRIIMQKMLAPYGETHVAVNGWEAVAVFELALLDEEPYDLVFLDIMMPEMDGFEVLKKIRKIEEKNGIIGPDWAKIIMMSGINNPKSIMKAFNAQCEAYLVKPIQPEKVKDYLKQFGFPKLQ